MRKLVSCLMVTQKGREAFVAESTACFKAQTYDAKELITVMQPEVNPPTLGDLRNTSLARSTGKFTAQWDDDDLSAPRRLAEQIKPLVWEGADVCFLRRVTLRCVCGYEAFGMRREWEQTMVIRTSFLQGLQYSPMAKGEDSDFVKKLLARKPKVVLLDRPDLYIYRHHGNNTWPNSHFDTVFQCAQDRHKPSHCARQIIAMPKDS